MRHSGLKFRVLTLVVCLLATLALCLTIANVSKSYADPPKQRSGGLSLVTQEKKPLGKVIVKNGKGIAPKNAPPRVKRIIRAANRISHTPYKWGGGHGSWEDTGYDCSGSVSFALRGGNMLSSPRTSGGFTNYGSAGQGKWITLYTNSGHIWMKFRGGVKFDTSGASPSRWQSAKGTSMSSYVVRHPKGL